MSWDKPDTESKSNDVVFVDSPTLLLVVEVVVFALVKKPIVAEPCRAVGCVGIGR